MILIKLPTAFFLETEMPVIEIDIEIMFLSDRQNKFGYSLFLIVYPSKHKSHPYTSVHTAYIEGGVIKMVWH